MSKTFFSYKQGNWNHKIANIISVSAESNKIKAKNHSEIITVQSV